MGLLKEVLKDIKPDKENDEIVLFLNKLKNLVKDSNINATVFTGGSLAKGTFLKNDHEERSYVKNFQSNFMSMTRQNKEIIGNYMSFQR